VANVIEPAGPDNTAHAPSNDGARFQLPVVRLFAVSLGVLLLGYMFLGRGFAHIGLPPLYIGEVVLAICIIATGFAFWRNGVRVAPNRILWLLLGLMALGAVRTLPYVGQYGFDALRDATLWGYAVFALMVFALSDRDLVVRAFRLYGWVVPVFALWLPISYKAFSVLSGSIDPTAQGTSVPLIFFKGGDMAVHLVGLIAFLVLVGPTNVWSSSFLVRVIVAVPLSWTAFVASAANRGALLTVVLGLLVVVALAPRSRNWLPLLVGAVILTVGVSVGGTLLGFGPAAPASTPSSTPLGSELPAPSPTRAASGSPPASHAASPSASPAETASSGATTRPTEGPLEPSASDAPSASSSAGDQVRIVNPGFERTSPDASVEGWAPFGAGGYSIVSAGAHGGERFAQIDNTAGAYQATLTSSRFPFTAGDDIEVSLWAKAVRGRPIVEVYVNWYDRAGERISSVVVGGRSTGGSKVWREVVGTYTAPPEAARAELLLWEAAGHAAIGIDDVTVRAGEHLVPEPPVIPPPKGRPATFDQLIDNILSLFVPSSDADLEGTKQFRLAWWGTIVDYTVFGDYFWTGKGFGVNLADVDGFQSTLDHSLRAPHNSHVTVLARMGVPGFVLWVVLQAAFGIGLLRTTLTNRRAGDLALAAVGGWLLAYWVAMMLDTSFDPYLEGPQGGIWFWAVFGLGLVVMRLGARRQTT
jgi:hypothetical protein